LTPFRPQNKKPGKSRKRFLDWGSQADSGVFDTTQNIDPILYTTNVNVQEAARNISQELTLNASKNLR
jgi:hypothetical protein